jgi:hypothetical protein
MERGRVILTGMSRYDRMKYTKRPERRAPGSINKKV